MGFWADHLRRKCDECFTIVGEDGTPYLRRYVLIKLPWFKVYVHEILRSDEDPELHDHPWDFTTFLLSGGYVEEIPLMPYGNWTSDVPMKKIHWPRFSVIKHRAEDMHRLELKEPVWTLFIAGSKRRDWGFLTKDGWKYNMDFLRQKFIPSEANSYRLFMGDDE